VAAELAGRKGWQRVGQELPAEIAKLTSADSRVVARCEEKCDTLMHRLAKVFWRGSYERSLPIADGTIFDADTMVNLAHKVMEEKASMVTGSSLAGVLPTFSVTATAYLGSLCSAHGKRHFAGWSAPKMKEQEALEMSDTIDQERALFVRKYFNAEWPCRRLYHTMLNSDAEIGFVTQTILNLMDKLEAARSFAGSAKLSDRELQPNAR